MPTKMDVEVVNDGASTSTSAAVAQKAEKKKNQPWIEKYRPQKFEEIMGENENFD